MAHRRQEDTLGLVGGLGALLGGPGPADLASQVERPDQRDGDQGREEAAQLENLVAMVAPEVAPAPGEARRPGLDYVRDLFRRDCQLRLLQDAAQLRLVLRHPDADGRGDVLQDPGDLDAIVEILGRQVATGVVAAQVHLALPRIDRAHGLEERGEYLELNRRIVASYRIDEKVAFTRRQGLPIQIGKPGETPAGVTASTGRGHQYGGAAQVRRQDLQWRLEQLGLRHGRGQKRPPLGDEPVGFQSVWRAQVGELQATALADQFQVVTANAGDAAVPSQLAQRPERVIDGHGDLRVAVQPALFRRCQLHARFVDAQAAAGAPAAQDVFPITPGYPRYRPVDDAPQRLVSRPQQEAEALAVDGSEVVDAQAQQVMGLHQVMRGHGIPQHRIDVPQHQRFERALRRIEKLHLAMGVGLPYRLFLKITDGHSQNGTGLVGVEGLGLRRHQHRPVGQVGLAEQQAIFPAFDVAARAQQVDLATAQGRQRGCPRRVDAHLRRPFEHQAQVVGGDALVAIAIEHRQGRIIETHHPDPERPSPLQPLPRLGVQPRVTACGHATGQGDVLRMNRKHR